ncbi:endopeptidase [Bordetella sp. LUAb4]|uniref:endopeptidase n=1 Tax=Bordetella sp. LUAb4 TaxID=2843195 RepID=UPI001E4600DF|nr:endopeptidase [Bordetella sp. LUAb4]
MMTKTLILASVLAVSLSACNKKEDAAPAASSTPSTSAPATTAPSTTAPSTTAPSTTTPGGAMSPAPSTGGSTTAPK